MLFVTCDVIPFIEVVTDSDSHNTVLVLLAPSQKWNLAPCEQLRTGDDLRLIWPRGEDGAARHSH